MNAPGCVKDYPSMHRVARAMTGGSVSCPIRVPGPAAA